MRFLIASIVLAVLPLSLSAEDLTVIWQNESSIQVATGLLIDLGDDGTITKPTTCEPMAVCEDTFQVDAGAYSATLRARPDGGGWSDPSNTRSVTVENSWVCEGPVPPECRADFDGDGVVSIPDFTAFLRAYAGRCEP